VSAERPEVWVYREGGMWEHAADPVPWESTDPDEDRRGAGYSPLTWLGTPGDGGGKIVLHYRPGRPPECALEVWGNHDIGVDLYVDRLPDALELLARWAPLISATAATDAALEAHQLAEAAHIAEHERKRGHK